MEYRPLYYRRFVDDIFVLFKSSDHLKRFQSYLNSGHVNMPLTIETEQKMFNAIRQQYKFITSVYQKPTFSGVYIHFDSFLPDIYKIGMIYTLVNRCLRRCCSWSMFHHELILLREIFLGLKLQKSIEGVLNCCKLQVIFKSQNKLCNNFRFKDPVLQTLTSGVVYNFQCGLGNEYYNEECVRHLVVRTG